MVVPQGKCLPGVVVHEVIVEMKLLSIIRDPANAPIEFEEHAFTKIVETDELIDLAIQLASKHRRDAREVLLILLDFYVVIVTQLKWKDHFQFLAQRILSTIS